MSKFFFRAVNSKQGTMYELTCTARVKISRNASVTMHRVESGKDITDNHRLENSIVSFEGVITNIISPSRKGSMSADQFLKEVKELREASPPVLLDVFAENELVRNCLITTLDIEKTKIEGRKSWRASIVFKEVEFSERARLVEVKEAKKAIADDVAAVSSSSGSPTTEPEREIVSTVLVDAGSGAYNMLKGALSGAPVAPTIPTSTSLPTSVPTIRGL